MAKVQNVDKENNDMLAKRVIEESDSPWSSPIVLVNKKENSIRFCIDFRKLNEITTKDSHSIPRIESTLRYPFGIKILLHNRFEKWIFAR